MGTKQQEIAIARLAALLIVNHKMDQYMAIRTASAHVIDKMPIMTAILQVKGFCK